VSRASVAPGLSSQGRAVGRRQSECVRVSGGVVGGTWWANGRGVRCNGRRAWWKGGRVVWSELMVGLRTRAVCRRREQQWVVGI
jgi:hypothetical protein